MRRFLCLLMALSAFFACGRALSDEAYYPIKDDAALVREADEARLIQLGFLIESGSQSEYTRAVKEFQRYLQRLDEDTPAESLPATTLEVLGESGDQAPARALSIKPLVTYSDIESIGAFQDYAVIENEGTLDEDNPPDAPDAAAGEAAEDGDAFTGILDEASRTRLYDLQLPVYRETLRQGSSGAEVRRIQRRLVSLRYLDHAADGIYDVKTAQAMKRFERAAGLAETEEAGRTAQAALFSEEAAANDEPLYQYMLKVDIQSQTVLAYGWDGGAYTLVEREMVCSTGLDKTPTPKGTYRATGPVARWCYFPTYDCWAQYAFRIKGGVLFHSVLYDQPKEETLLAGSVKKLGRKSSQGCVRLSVEDAKWIFDNCAAGTTVLVE
jgi:lipoprotein-anchoring transpeptidase ErfK/SrfK